MTDAGLLAAVKCLADGLFLMAIVHGVFAVVAAAVRR